MELRSVQVFVLNDYGAGDGNRTHVRNLGAHQTCDDEKFRCNFGAIKEGKEPSIFP